MSIITAVVCFCAALCCYCARVSSILCGSALIRDGEAGEETLLPIKAR